MITRVQNRNGFHSRVEGRGTPGRATKVSFLTRCRYCGQEVVYWENYYGSKVFFNPWERAGGLHRLTCPSPANPYREEVFDPALAVPMNVHHLISRAQADIAMTHRRVYLAGLKSKMLAYCPSFDERDYGFPKFHDLLAYFEALGWLCLARDEKGVFVQWAHAQRFHPRARSPAHPTAPARDARTGKGSQ